MTTRKKWYKEIKETVEEENCELIEIKQTKTHNKVYIKLPNSKQIFISTGGTPSDSRKGKLNFRNDIKRMKNKYLNKVII